jgi:hypothetical protein
MEEAFTLRPLSEIVDQQQIEITTHRGRTAAVTAKQTNASEIGVQALQIFGPGLGLLQHLLSAGPSQNRLRQGAHGHGREHLNFAAGRSDRWAHPREDYPDNA